MNTKLLLLVPLLLVGFCENNDEEISKSNIIHEGIYDYVSYDSLGTVIIEGLIEIITSNPDSITGEWNFEKVGHPQNIGPQIGTGRLYGSFHREKIWINLNPDIVDDNVNLNGIFDSYFHGQWNWSTLHGLQNHGTFEAVKR